MVTQSNKIQTFNGLTRMTEASYPRKWHLYDEYIIR